MENIQLSPHFSLFELTVTSNSELQEKNRELTDEQIEKLRALAAHCESIRAICEAPVRIHSGYRSPDLNSATHGASSTSQHPRCEAVDLDVPSQTIEDTFNALLEAARAGKFKFGQLIIEQADRGYKNPDGTEAYSKWVHCSVVGTLAPEKVGQVLRMKAGPDGKSVYTMIDHLSFA